MMLRKKNVDLTPEDGTNQRLFYDTSIVKKRQIIHYNSSIFGGVVFSHFL